MASWEFMGRVWSRICMDRWFHGYWIWIDSGSWKNVAISNDSGAALGAGSAVCVESDVYGGSMYLFFGQSSLSEPPQTNAQVIRISNLNSATTGGRLRGDLETLLIFFVFFFLPSFSPHPLNSTIDIRFHRRWFPFLWEMSTCITGSSGDNIYIDFRRDWAWDCPCLSSRKGVRSMRR